MGSNEEFTNGACAKYEILLEDFLDGSLAGAEARVVAEHMNQCAGCRGALDEAVAGSRLLHAAHPAADPGLGFSRVVMARIRTSQSEQSGRSAGFWQPFVTVGWRFAATAMLALGALLTYNHGQSRRPQPNVASARPTDMRDMFSSELASGPSNVEELLMSAMEVSHGRN